jgi:hypothetical protein
MHDENISISSLLQKLVEDHKNSESIKLSEIMESLHERGFGLLMVFFSFPIAVPLPYPPGFTTIFGIPMLLLSTQMILGLEKPWLPKRISNKAIKVTTLFWAIEKTNKYFVYIEKIMKPRFSWVTEDYGERIIGFFVLLCAISITLPIVLGNAIPSAGILVMSLGLLSRDGLMAILGIIISIIGLVIATAVVMLGVTVVIKIFSFIPGFEYIIEYIHNF